MQAPEKYLTRFPQIADRTRRTYAAMLSAMDDGVGRVVRALRDEGLEEDTLIIFFNDNGGPTMQGTTINGSRNTPLRGSKRQTWEGGLRIPMAIKWPGVIKPGTVSNEIISLLAAGSHRQLGEEDLLRLREVPVSGGTALNAGSINYTMVRTKEALERLGKLETLHPAS